MIELKNIQPTYMSEAEVSASDIFLMDNVTFNKGMNYLIKAHSGRGKSTILNIIYGNNPNYNGNVIYKFQENNNPIEIRRKHISYVFQDFKLFPDLTLMENIQLKNRLTNHKSTQEINQLIEKVQLDHRVNHLVGKLSLGQRQRVAIIRSLCQPFDFLLMDEPFSHLDENNIHIISDIIKDELTERNAGLIITSLDDQLRFNYDKILNL
ncbi:MAG: ATP-binding cassette domain-containing protein [Hyphomicrobiales bacterium]